MKTYVVVNSSKGVFAPFERLRAKNFRSALSWCFKNGYDLIEEI